MTIILLKLIATVIMAAIFLDSHVRKSKFVYILMEHILPWVFIVLLFSFGFSLIWFGWV